MLRLILMRHAEAEPARGGRDHDRPLSKAGQREGQAAGRLLLAAGIVPALALVSDSVRTLATLDAVSAGLGSRPPVQALPGLYGASPDTILAAVRELPASVRTALVIGHNPGIGECARALARDGDAAELLALQAHFPTACCAVLALDTGEWPAAARGRLARLIGGKPG